VAVRRNADLQRYLTDRYGCEWPDDDAGRDDLWLAVHSLTTVGKWDGEVRAFIASKAPWLSESETLQMLDKAYALPRPYGAAKLGQKVGLTDQDRDRLKLWSIDAADDPGRLKRRERKRLDRIEQQTARRRKRGVKSWDESATRTKPWIAAGFKTRRTWERHGKPNVAKVKPGELTFRSRLHICDTTSETVLIPRYRPRYRTVRRQWDIRSTDDPDVVCLVFRSRVTHEASRLRGAQTDDRRRA